MSAGDGSYSVVMTPSVGARTFNLFPGEREMFLYLERLGVTYYRERGFTHLADGRMFEYGRVGE
jgi:hypothetical protein